MRAEGIECFEQIVFAYIGFRTLKQLSHSFCSKHILQSLAVSLQSGVRFTGNYIIAIAIEILKYIQCITPVTGKEFIQHIFLGSEGNFIVLFTPAQQHFMGAVRQGDERQLPEACGSENKRAAYGFGYVAKASAIGIVFLGKVRQPAAIPLVREIFWQGKNFLLFILGILCVIDGIVFQIIIIHEAGQAIKNTVLRMHLASVGAAYFLYCGGIPEKLPSILIAECLRKNEFRG